MKKINIKDIRKEIAKQAKGKRPNKKIKGIAGDPINLPTPPSNWNPPKI